MDTNELPEFLWEKIPKQTTGISRDTFRFKNEQDKDDFERLKSSVLNVNEWVNFTGLTKTTFTLMNKHGIKQKRLARLNDFILIEFPKLFLFKKIKCYDWVEISTIETFNDSTMDYFILELKPAKSPIMSDQTINHFFTEEASNTFIVFLNKDFLSISIHGRNEFPNLFIKNKRDAIRNFFFANLGLFGANKLLWVNMTNGLMDVE